MLALAGLGVSIYLTVAHFTESTLARVLRKRAGELHQGDDQPAVVRVRDPGGRARAGLLRGHGGAHEPVGVAGSARREVHLVRMAALMAGIGFVLYLLYAELFIIGSICLYCTSVHAITFMLFVLTVFAAAAWGIPERQRG